MLWKFLSGALGGLLLTPLVSGQETKTVPAGTPVTITVTQAAPATPAVSLALNGRKGHATPHRTGCVHTGGGNIDVQQPAPDTVVVTLSGVAVATGHPCKGSDAGLQFDVSQCFEVVFDNPEVKAAKLTVEARVVGLLRSHCKGGGSAQVSGGATIGAESCEPLVTISLPDHSVAGGENLSINDHEGPLTFPVAAGKYTLHQVFSVAASHPRAILPCKASSAEFGPDALDPLWISYWEPFKGAAKKDFGFQLTIKVADDTPAEKNGKDKNGVEKVPLPKP